MEGNSEERFSVPETFVHSHNYLDDEPDVFSKIIKRVFFEITKFPDDICKECFVIWFEILFDNLYGTRFVENLNVLVKFHNESLSVVMKLHDLCKNTIRGNFYVVYPSKEYFQVFSKETNNLVNLFTTVKTPVKKFILSSFYAEVMNHWSVCVANRWYGCKEHYKKYLISLK